MSEKILESNKAEIVGKVVSEPVFNYHGFYEKIYRVEVETNRLSGTSDTIPVLIPENLLDVTKSYKGKYIEVKGQFRSYLDRKERHLKLNLFAKEVNLLEELKDDNYIFLDGHICKPPIYRTTPLGREIADVFLAVNRPYGIKSDYIPCICWGGDAKYVGRLPVGTRIQVQGRIQSRQYQKYLEGNKTEIRTVYEVSVNRLKKIAEE